MSTAPPETPAGQRRRRWLVPTLIGGGLLLVAVLALTQPWLLWVDEVAQEQLPVVAGQVPASPSPAAEAAPAASPAAPASPEASPGSPTPSTPEPSPEPVGPVELATGSFISRDHATSGDVAIVQLEDGTRVLTIDGLQTDNGPDLYVYLDDDPADAAEGDFDDGIDLGRLRGNVGDLVYELPADVDLGAVTSVVIWCDRFSSAFGAADLARG